MAIYVLGMVITTYVMVLFRERIARRINGSIYVSIVQAGVVILWPLLITVAAVLIGFGILMWVGKFAFNNIVIKR